MTSNMQKYLDKAQVLIEHFLISSALTVKSS